MVVEGQLAEGGVGQQRKPAAPCRQIEKAPQHRADQTTVGDDQAGLAVGQPGDQFIERRTSPVGNLPGRLAGHPHPHVVVPKESC